MRIRSFVMLTALHASTLFAATDLKTALDTAYKDEYEAFVRYQSAIQLFGDRRPFQNLVGAEKRHMDELAQLYASFGWSPPQITLPLMTFSSVQEACRVSLIAEQENVELYDRLLQDRVEPAVRATFLRLRDASAERHIPALTRCGSR